MKQKIKTLFSTIFIVVNVVKLSLQSAIADPDSDASQFQFYLPPAVILQAPTTGLIFHQENFTCRLVLFCFEFIVKISKIIEDLTF